MIVKLVATFVLLGVCYALPVEESKDVEVAPTYGLVPLDPPVKVENKPEEEPVKVEDLSKPSKSGESDLQPDASTWWHHNWYHHGSPAYYYHSVPRTHYTYWKSYY